MEITWQAVFFTLIALAIAAAGAPITQVIKNTLGIKDRAALVLTGGVAAVIAVGELWLTNMIGVDIFTKANFPAAFFTVFSVSTIYYQLLKGSNTFFGKKGLLRKLPTDSSSGVM